jgi:hypothetical protein
MTFESGDRSSMDSVRGGIFQIRLKECLNETLGYKIDFEFTHNF